MNPQRSSGSALPRASPPPAPPLHPLPMLPLHPCQPPLHPAYTAPAPPPTPPRHPHLPCPCTPPMLPLHPLLHCPCTPAHTNAHSSHCALAPRNHYFVRLVPPHTLPTRSPGITRTPCPHHPHTPQSPSHPSPAPLESPACTTPPPTHNHPTLPTPLLAQPHIIYRTLCHPTPVRTTPLPRRTPRARIPFPPTAPPPPLTAPAALPEVLDDGDDGVHEQVHVEQQERPVRQVDEPLDVILGARRRSEPDQQ